MSYGYDFIIGVCFFKEIENVGYKDIFFFVKNIIFV